MERFATDFNVVKHSNLEYPLDYFSLTITDKVLNKELRSTLTKWQAKYRRWYELEYRQPTKETPQQIQRRYPEYSNMIADIMSTNKKMVYYSDCVKKIAFKNNTNS